MQLWRKHYANTRDFAWICLDLSRPECLNIEDFHDAGGNAWTPSKGLQTASQPNSLCTESDWKVVQYGLPWSTRPRVAAGGPQTRPHTLPSMAMAAPAEDKQTPPKLGEARDDHRVVSLIHERTTEWSSILDPEQGAAHTPP